jgi:hypothetical protein
VTDKNGKAHRRRKSREWSPVDVLGQDRSESRLAWLMRAGHVNLLQPFAISQIARSEPAGSTNVKLRGPHEIDAMAVAQPVSAPLTRAAIFLVVTRNRGGRPKLK